MSIGLNAREIKIIACVSMLFSHVGIIFCPQAAWLQIIGRAAMPLFAFMIANGARHSHDIRAYVARLLIFAAIIQYPYSIFMGLGYMNICFTLGLGLVAILVWQGPWPQYLRILAVLTVGLAAEYANCEYGLYGILMIMAAHIFFEDWNKLALCWLFINIPELFSIANALMTGGYMRVQGFALLALPILYFYNGQKGGGWRWEFYVFYIGHMAVLYGLRQFLWGY